MSDADAALSALLRLLETRRYRFVTPTPATHARVLARPDRRVARSLVDALGWSLPAPHGLLDAEVEQLLRAAQVLEDKTGLQRSLVRVSSLHGRLYLHSAYPTDSDQAVFFGPDSYRFADLILTDRPAARSGMRIVDMGTGAGVGAVVAATAFPQAEVIMTDTNPHALRFARLNAAAARVSVTAVLAGDLSRIDGPIDLALANPPYIIDGQGREYRDGGGLHGGQASLDMARQAIERLAPGGRLILYTGSAILGGADPLAAALAALARDLGCAMRYRELDPDVFGEELAGPQYADVDRIALVAAIVDRPQ